jgi:hypothetical protein
MPYQILYPLFGIDASKNQATGTYIERSGIIIGAVAATRADSVKPEHSPLYQIVFHSHDELLHV